MDPVALAAGGLMALVFGVAIFNSDDDDSSSPDELALDPETGTVTGTDGADDIDMVEINEADTQPGVEYIIAHAGDGNDTVNAEAGGEIYGEDGDDILTVLRDLGGVTDGGAGDDILNVTPVTGSVLGGEGNDTINYDGRERGLDGGNTIDGGAGDDVLNAILGEAGGAMDGHAPYDPISGGAGNDTISVTCDPDGQFYGAGIDMGDGSDLLIVDGPVGHQFGVLDGAGDDTIRFEQMTASPDESGAYARGFLGGSGNDVYEFTLMPDAGADLATQFNVYPYAGIISGFETGADRLVVDPYSLVGDATYTGYSLTGNGTTGYQEVAFHYTHPDYPEGLAVSIAFRDTWIRAEDIEVIGGPGTTTA